MTLPHSILLFLFLLVGIISAGEIVPRVDRDYPPVQRGNLEMYRDMSIVPKDLEEHVHMYSGIAVFPEGTDLTKEELVKLAYDAHHIVREDKGLDGNQIPMVTNALKVGNEVYLATSVRTKRASVVYVDRSDPLNNNFQPTVVHQIRSALTECFNDPLYESRFHLYEGTCGEMMGLWAYFKRNKDKVDVQGAVSAAWQYGHKKNKKGQWDVDEQLKDACEQHRRAPNKSLFGCKQILDMMQVRGIRRADNIQMATTRPEVKEMWFQSVSDDCQAVKKVG